jgi:multiple antibiotic resistance protein
MAQTFAVMSMVVVMVTIDHGHYSRFPTFNKTPPMDFRLDELLTVTFTLFAVIDVVGSVPLLISLKGKIGGIRSLQATLVSGVLMILFLFAGKPFLKMLGLDIRSFAVGGSVVIFLLGLEMVLGHEIFKGDKDAKAGTLVPIAFPIIAGSGTLTTVMSLKANFEEVYILLGILINLVVVYFVLRSLKLIEKILGPAGLLAVRKFFGVILIAIAVKIFSSNIGAFGK